MDESDPKGCSFGIQVLGRIYHLRAESRASCKDWVITLNRVKEARLQQGNVKLVDPAHSQPVDLLDPSQDIVAPRIVVVANRERTRAVDESQEWDELMIRSSQQETEVTMALEPRRSALGTAVLARWSKRKSSLSHLSAKLARWARSVRKYRCGQAADDVELDHHVHPPGHDDHKAAIKGESLNAWIGKETSRSAPTVPDEEVVKAAPDVSDCSEDDPRYLS